jgi:hypothetical protein
MFTCKKFELTEREYKKIEEWDKTHECKLKPKHGVDKYCGAIGGSLSVEFTPTSIGTFITVKCSCGAMLDLDDGI